MTDTGTFQNKSKVCWDNLRYSGCPLKRMAKLIDFPQQGREKCKAINNLNDLDNSCRLLLYNINPSFLKIDDIIKDIKDQDIRMQSFLEKSSEFYKSILNFKDAIDILRTYYSDIFGGSELSGRCFKYDNTGNLLKNTDATFEDEDEKICKYFFSKSKEVTDIGNKKSNLKTTYNKMIKSLKNIIFEIVEYNNFFGQIYEREKEVLKQVFFLGPEFIDKALEAIPKENITRNKLWHKYHMDYGNFKPMKAGGRDSRNTKDYIHRSPHFEYSFYWANFWNLWDYTDTDPSDEMIYKQIDRVNIKNNSSLKDTCLDPYWHTQSDSDNIDLRNRSVITPLISDMYIKNLSVDNLILDENGDSIFSSETDLDPDPEKVLYLINKCKFIIESFISWRPIIENPIIDITFHEVLKDIIKREKIGSDYLNGDLRLDFSKESDQQLFNNLMNNNIDNYNNCKESLFPILNMLDSQKENITKANNLRFNISDEKYTKSPDKVDYNCESNSFKTENYLSSSKNYLDEKNWDVNFNWNMNETYTDLTNDYNPFFDYKPIKLNSNYESTSDLCMNDKKEIMLNIYNNLRKIYNYHLILNNYKINDCLIKTDISDSYNYRLDFETCDESIYKENEDTINLKFNNYFSNYIRFYKDVITYMDDREYDEVSHDLTNNINDICNDSISKSNCIYSYNKVYEILNQNTNDYTSLIGSIYFPKKNENSEILPQNDNLQEGYTNKDDYKITDYSCFKSIDNIFKNYTEKDSIDQSFCYNIIEDIEQNMILNTNTNTNKYKIFKNVSDFYNIGTDNKKYITSGVNMSSIMNKPYINARTSASTINPRNDCINNITEEIAKKACNDVDDCEGFYKEQMNADPKTGRTRFCFKKGINADTYVPEPKNNSSFFIKENNIKYRYKIKDNDNKPNIWREYVNANTFDESISLSSDPDYKPLWGINPAPFIADDGDKVVFNNLDKDHPWNCSGEYTNQNGAKLSSIKQACEKNNDCAGFFSYSTPANDNGKTSRVCFIYKKYLGNKYKPISLVERKQGTNVEPHKSVFLKEEYFPDIPNNIMGDSFSYEEIYDNCNIKKENDLDKTKLYDYCNFYPKKSECYNIDKNNSKNQETDLYNIRNNCNSDPSCKYLKTISKDGNITKLCKQNNVDKYDIFESNNSDTYIFKKNDNLELISDDNKDYYIHYQDHFVPEKLGLSSRLNLCKYADEYYLSSSTQGYSSPGTRVTPAQQAMDINYQILKDCNNKKWPHYTQDNIYSNTSPENIKNKIEWNSDNNYVSINDNDKLLDVNYDYPKSAVFYSEKSRNIMNKKLQNPSCVDIAGVPNTEEGINSIINTCKTICNNEDNYFNKCRGKLVDEKSIKTNDGNWRFEENILKTQNTDFLRQNENEYINDQCNSITNETDCNISVAKTIPLDIKPNTGFEIVPSGEGVRCKWIYNENVDENDKSNYGKCIPNISEDGIISENDKCQIESPEIQGKDCSGFNAWVYKNDNRAQATCCFKNSINIPERDDISNKDSVNLMNQIDVCNNSITEIANQEDKTNYFLNNNKHIIKSTITDKGSCQKLFENASVDDKLGLKNKDTALGHLEASGEWKHDSTYSGYYSKHPYWYKKQISEKTFDELYKEYESQESQTEEGLINYKDYLNSDKIKENDKTYSINIHQRKYKEYKKPINDTEYELSALDKKNINYLYPEINIDVNTKNTIFIPDVNDENINKCQKICDNLEGCDRLFYSTSNSEPYQTSCSFYTGLYDQSVSEEDSSEGKYFISTSDEKYNENYENQYIQALMNSNCKIRTNIDSKINYDDIQSKKEIKIRNPKCAQFIASTECVTDLWPGTNQFNSCPHCIGAKYQSSAMRAGCSDGGIKEGCSIHDYKSRSNMECLNCIKDNINNNNCFKQLANILPEKRKTYLDQEYCKNNLRNVIENVNINSECIPDSYCSGYEDKKTDCNADIYCNFEEGEGDSVGECKSIKTCSQYNSKAICNSCGKCVCPKEDVSETNETLIQDSRNCNVIKEKLKSSGIRCNIDSDCHGDNITGKCINNYCVCDKGYIGNKCQYKNNYDPNISVSCNLDNSNSDLSKCMNKDILNNYCKDTLKYCYNFDTYNSPEMSDNDVKYNIFKKIVDIESDINNIDKSTPNFESEESIYFKDIRKSETFNNDTMYVDRSEFSFVTYYYKLFTRNIPFILTWLLIFMILYFKKDISKYIEKHSIYNGVFKVE